LLRAGQVALRRWRHSTTIKQIPQDSQTPSQRLALAKIFWLPGYTFSQTALSGRVRIISSCSRLFSTHNINTALLLTAFFKARSA
jgi:hypothetical protein